MPRRAVLGFVVSGLVLTAAVVARQQELAVVIQSGPGDLYTGDEIPITFVISNTGTGVHTYTDRSYDRSGRMGEYRLEASDERGVPLPDPRTTSPVPQGYIGGGLGTPSELKPGQTFSKTIPLNLWALITAPGVYTVRGSYVLETGVTITSAPLSIRIRPRSLEEMGRYIEELTAQFPRTVGDDARAQLVRRLMFTGDRRAAAPLLAFSAHGNNTAFWIGEAFAYYLPRDGALLDDAVAAMRGAGLSPAGTRILEQLEAPRDTIKELIGQSLRDEKDAARNEAALAAQRYPDDRFMPALIALALNGSGEARLRAIYAVAANRTDAGVDALRTLRRDADPEIRTTTERAIDLAYAMAGRGPGRPLRADDFADRAKK